MHQIDHAIVRQGKIVLTGLPFPDGQRVSVSVTPEKGKSPHSRSIDDVRQLLRGGVERFDEPTQPMIPEEHWEMLR